MTLGAHLAFAAVLYLGGATRFGYKPDWVSGALAAGASLLPDIDLPPAKIGRLFWWLSVPLERRFGHRTLTHSLVALSAVAALTAPLMAIDAMYFWAGVGGYWSHLWIDMLNVRGADLFWPAPLRVVTPGNRHWRLEVGSKGEMILLSGLLVAAAALAPLSQIGFRDGLQALLAAGQSVEVAGYMLHPQLAAAMAQARLQRPVAGLRVDWFELASDPARGLAPLSTRLVADWRQHGVAVEAQRVQGDPFWATQDISCAPALLAATVAALSGGA